MGGMGARAPVEYEEIQGGKGLKFGGGEAVKPQPKPPIPTKPRVDIDAKLNELKKKAQRKTISH